MKLTRAILLALAFAIPSVATVAHADDKEKAAAPAGDTAPPDAKEPKKAKKSKGKAKKEGDADKKDEAPPAK
jgi:hypothetical protein